MTQLKKENERLRGGGGDLAKMSALERRARDARSEANALKEELTKVQTRLTSHEDSMTKLAQRNEQVCVHHLHMMIRVERELHGCDVLERVVHIDLA